MLLFPLISKHYPFSILQQNPFAGIPSRPIQIKNEDVYHDNADYGGINLFKIGACLHDYWAANSWSSNQRVEWDMGETKTVSRVRVKNEHEKDLIGRW